MTKIWFVFFISFAVLAEELPYVNWENHPDNSLDITINKSQLTVAHTTIAINSKKFKATLGTANLEFAANRNIDLSLTIHYSDNITDSLAIGSADSDALSSTFFDSGV